MIYDGPYIVFLMLLGAVAFVLLVAIAKQIGIL